MTRSGLLMAGVAIILGMLPRVAGGEEARSVRPGSEETGPRKVIVGTSMFAMWGQYPGLEARLAELGKLVDEMAAAARGQYGRGLDIAALPEVAVSGGLPLGPKGAFPLEGKVRGYFAAKAREHNCYIVVPMLLRETNKATGAEETYNAAILLDRKGEVTGIYRKVHPVAGYDNDVLEGGCLPGKSFPVFACDFGKVGIQICWDMAYDDGWEALARQDAELVIWTTQSPGQIKTAFRAMKGRSYVLTSTWRHNASLLDPTGHLIRAITRKEDRVFVEEIDLEYLLIGWQPKLGNGLALKERYGDKVGYRYSEAEDGGIFWSNDPATPIRQMVRELGLEAGDGKVERDRILQDKARGGPPERPRE
jgi:predicted amidohydrolase